MYPTVQPGAPAKPNIPGVQGLCISMPSGMLSHGTLPLTGLNYSPMFRARISLRLAGHARIPEMIGESRQIQVLSIEWSGGAPVGKIWVANTRMSRSPVCSGMLESEVVYSGAEMAVVDLKKLRKGRWCRTQGGQAVFCRVLHARRGVRNVKLLEGYPSDVLQLTSMSCLFAMVGLHLGWFQAHDPPITGRFDQVLLLERRISGIDLFPRYALSPEIDQLLPQKPDSWISSVASCSTKRVTQPVSYPAQRPLRHDSSDLRRSRTRVM
jgi:hypothetical protein